MCVCVTLRVRICDTVCVIVCACQHRPTRVCWPTFVLYIHGYILYNLMLYRTHIIMLKCKLCMLVHLFNY